MWYVKKPIPVEAIQITHPTMSLHGWAAKAVHEDDLTLDEDCWSVWTLEGYMYANYGSYLIKGPYGELYPCRKDVFEETYERVEKN